MAETAADEPPRSADAAAVARTLAQVEAAAGRDVAAALVSTEQELTQARAAAQPAALLLALLAHGVTCQRAAQYDRALLTLRQSLDLALRHDAPAAVGAIRRALGHVHDELGEYPQALAEHLHALAMDEATGDDNSRASTLRTIGIIYSKAGDPLQGVAFYRESLALSRRLNDSTGAARTLNNLGINLKNLGRLEESAAALEEARHLFTALDSRAGMAGSASNLGHTRLAQGDLAQAESLQRDAVSIAQAAGYALAEVNGQRGLAEVLLAAGRPAQAHEAALQALATAERMASRPERARCHRTLVDVCKALGDAAAALDHFERFHAIERQIFSEESDRKLRALQVGYQVRELARQSTEDGLTGVANRRQLDARLAEEFAAARSRGRALAVALIDIDDFKQVNDLHSHATGDAVLRTLARLLRSHCREADLPARYGGEEFALVLPATDVQGAAVLCDKLRAAIAAHDWHPLAAGLRVTVSIGVAATGSVDADAGFIDCADVATLLERADARLYEAKRNGKNQVRR